MIANRWIRGGCIAAAFMMAAVLLLAAHEIGEVNLVSHPLHQVEHVFYYGVMAFLLAQGLGRRWFWIALLAIPLVGALDEWNQLYVPGRSGSVFDWAVDVLGTVVALYIYYRWTAGPKGERL